MTHRYDHFPSSPVRGGTIKSTFLWEQVLKHPLSITWPHLVAREAGNVVFIRQLYTQLKSQKFYYHERQEVYGDKCFTLNALPFQLRQHT